MARWAFPQLPVSGIGWRSEVSSSRRLRTPVLSSRESTILPGDRGRCPGLMILPKRGAARIISTAHHGSMTEQNAWIRR
jgi:hypothetical protein